MAGIVCARGGNICIRNNWDNCSTMIGHDDVVAVFCCSVLETLVWEHVGRRFRDRIA